VTTRGGQTNGTERHQGALELQRLITSGSSGDDWAVELLKAAAPQENAAGRKQRILMALAYPAEKRGGLLLRRMVVAGIVVVFGCGTAIASAALGHWPKWAARAYESLIGAPAVSGPARVGATLPVGHGRRVGGNLHEDGAGSPDVEAMAEAADCAGCHTADPSKPFAGGRRIDTPFGAIYSPNLTPDRDTGIGAWSDDESRYLSDAQSGVGPSRHRRSSGSESCEPLGNCRLGYRSVLDW